MQRAALRAILWQIGGGLVAMMFIVACMGELLWCSLFLSDRTNVSPRATLVVHVFAAISAALLFLYHRLRTVREADLARAPVGRPRFFGMKFRLFSFPIHMQWIFVGMALLLSLSEDWNGYWLRSAFVAIAVLVHELGHAVAARRMGMDEIRISLHALGGTTTYIGWPRRAQEAAILIAGPATGIFLGIATVALGNVSSSFRTSLAYHDALFVTLGWSLLNLIPILPLDGGALLASALRSQLTARVLSLVFAVAGVAASVPFRKAGLVAFFGMLALTNLGAIPTVADGMKRLNRRIG
jgi:Zn-dependent protease